MVNKLMRRLLARRVAEPRVEEEPVQAEVTATEAEVEPQPEPEADALIGYCLKCKEKREIANAKRVQTTKGQPAILGKCSVCGRKMFKMLPA